MSININQYVGEALIKQLEAVGFMVWVNDGDAQVRVRDRLAQPVITLGMSKSEIKQEMDRAASHTPRALPPALSAELNNKRGSILVALRARAAAAKAAEPVVAVAEPVMPPTGVINQPGFGDHEDAGDEAVDSIQSLEPADTTPAIPADLDPLLQDTQ